MYAHTVINGNMSSFLSFFFLLNISYNYKSRVILGWVRSLPQDLYPYLKLRYHGISCKTRTGTHAISSYC